MSLAVLGSVAAGAAGGSGSGVFNGTTGWTDFSEIDAANLDAAPAGWTKRLAFDNHAAGMEFVTKVVKGRGIGGRLFVIDTNADGFAGTFRGMITWDTPGVLPATCEVLVLMNGQSTTGHGPGQTENVAPSGGFYTPPYMVAISTKAIATNARLQAAKKDAASNAYGLGAFVDTALAIGGRYYIRMRRDGTRLRAKVWAAGGAEPGAYQLDTTEALFSAVATGFPGIGLIQYTNDGSNQMLRIEYLSVSTNPAVSPAPLPTGGDAATGGNFGVVDLPTAAISGAGFVHYPLAGVANFAAAIEARGGSKHGTVLRVTGAAGNVRGFLAWAPAGLVCEGDVLALVEVGGLIAGAGLVYPSAANAGIYDRAFRSVAFVREPLDRTEWGREKNGQDASWPAGLTAALGAVVVGEKWWIRHRRSKNVVQIRAWKDGVAEPGAWAIDNNAAGNNDYDVTGYPVFGYDFNAAGSVYLEHLAWTDDPTANPVNPV